MKFNYPYHQKQFKQNKAAQHLSNQTPSNTQQDKDYKQLHLETMSPKCAARLLPQ